jgi:hypothetical protein
MAFVLNKTAGPRGAFIKAEGAEFALVEVWANPGQTIEADDWNEDWFTEVDGPDKKAGAAPKAKPAEGDDEVDDELIAAAIGELDSYNDDHWTRDGQPAVDAVAAILEAKVTRADIKRAAPEASRPQIGD